MECMCLLIIHIFTENTRAVVGKTPQRVVVTNTIGYFALVLAKLLMSVNVEHVSGYHVHMYAVPTSICIVLNISAPLTPFNWLISRKIDH